MRVLRSLRLYHILKVALLVILCLARVINARKIGEFCVGRAIKCTVKKSECVNFTCVCTTGYYATSPKTCTGAANGYYTVDESGSADKLVCQQVAHVC